MHWESKYGRGLQHLKWYTCHSYHHLNKNIKEIVSDMQGNKSRKVSYNPHTVRTVIVLPRSDLTNIL